MIRSGIVATIAGHPQPKGSLKCIGARGRRGHVLIEDNAGTKPWRDELTRWLRQVQQHADKRQAIAVEITSTLERPGSHYGTGRNAGTVKGSAPSFPTTHGTGDVDKLARLVLDALQDVGILADDAQVLEVVSRKFYTTNPGMTSLLPDQLPYPGVVIRITPYHP